MRLLISEVLQKAHNAKTKAQKIKILRENDAPEGTEHPKLEKEGRILHHFFKGGSNIPRMRREQMFIQLLEGLHPDEAKVVILAKDGILNKRYKITKACVEETFPQIKWGNRG